MARKIYKRIGIRRDNNLADLSNTKEGLNNLLDGLASDDVETTFISEDLNVIRNLFAEGMESEQYRKVAESRTQITTPSGSSEDFLPPITYQNKLDKFKFFAGEPRLNGGNGLTARYYNQDDINISTTNIFSGTPFEIDNFWEAGNFNYTGKITPTAQNSNGGIEWNGFFIPTRTGLHRFEYNSTASFTFEFEDIAESGTVTERMRVGTDHVISSDYSGQVAFGATFTASATGSGNEITLATPLNGNRVAIGMSVSGPNIVKDSKVFTVNSDSGVISLTHPSVIEPTAGTPAVTGAITSQNITFYKNIGVDTRKTYTTPPLIAYQKYKIKFRYFIPRYVGAGNTSVVIDASGLTRDANIDILYPGGNAFSNLKYTYLFGEDYDFSDDAKGAFPKFMDNSILFGGGKIGSPSLPPIKDEYVKVKTTKKIDVKYQPPTFGLDAIQKSEISCNLTNGSSVLNLDSPTTTFGIEIGNYVFGNNIPDNTRVIDIIINQFIILDKNTTGGGTQTLKFIDHRGFVKKVTGSTSTDTLTISTGNTTNLKKGMIVIMKDQTSSHQYTTIEEVTNATSIKISPNQGFANRSIFFYQDKGLINDSLIQYCLPTLALCLIVKTAVTSGSTVEIEGTIPSGITGWIATGFQFDPDTRISSVSGNGININLSKPIINPLVKGEKISIAPLSSNDRTLCCPPTDTSPPFAATEQGLETSSNFPNLKIISGDVKFDNLTVIKNITVESASPSDQSTQFLEIDTPFTSISNPNGIFKILCE